MPLKSKMQPASVIKARLGINPSGRIQKFFTNTCYKAMDEFVPMDNGDLRTIVAIDNNSITYEVPYARYQYYGKKMVMSNGKSAYYSPEYGFWSNRGEKKTVTSEDLHYHTPGTGPYWDKRMWSAKSSEVLRTVEEELRRGGN